jgi:Ser/Thr protein kinase RdoA (MazF antagonist)
MPEQELPSRVLAFFNLQGAVRQRGNAGGFSGARFWQLQAEGADWCVRRWPREHPSESRLSWIHAVLEHSMQRGFQLLPPLRTSSTGRYFIREAGFLWECSHWMPGNPTLSEDQSPGRIARATEALALFHNSVEDFPLGQEYNGLLAAPAIHSRQSYFLQLVRGKIDQLQSLLPGNDWIELNMRAGRIVERFVELRGQLEEVLELATRCRVKLVPCLRDVWHQHVLFVDDQVSSFVDFGALRIDSVATDIARLLGSVSTVGDDSWLAGLKAYQAVRPLDDDERELISTLELANRAMSGVQWLDWILLENRQFDDPEAVIKRLDDLICGPPEDPKS